MLHKERINTIREIIQKKGRVMTSELSDFFNVSEVTIRNDLALLSKEKDIEKIHGGAILSSKSSPQTLNYPNNMILQNQKIPNFNSKFQIAQYACNEVNNGDIIFLGSGATCCILAKLLKDKKNISVVTNNVTALSDLLEHNHKVYLVGGEVSTVDNHTYFSSIENPSQYLKSIYVNKAFTSCYGFDQDAGITVRSIISSYMYRAIPEIQQKWYLLLEKEKFDKIGMYQVGSIQDVECIITDNISKKYADFFQQSDVNFIST